MTIRLRNSPHTDPSFTAVRSPAATLVVALGVSALINACAAPAQGIGERNGNLTDTDGRTLYTFDKDSAGASNCAGPCASAWPPFFAKNGAKDNGAFTIITRVDGRKQWARDGKPLYFFVGDGQAGETRGDNNGGAWHVVKTDATQSSTATSSSKGYQADDYGYYYK